MKIGIFLTTFFITATTLFAAKPISLTDMNFKVSGNISRIELTFDSTDIRMQKTHYKDFKQTIVDFKNVVSTKRVAREKDTSEFAGSIVLVSAYKKPGSKNDFRIALQLRDNVRSVIKQVNNKVIIDVENFFGAFSEQDIKVQSVVTNNKVVDESLSKIHVPKSDSLKDILTNITMSGKKKYVGKKISFNFKEIKVEDILNMIADASGFNIIISDNISRLPPMTLRLANLPWDQALDTIMDLNNLVAKRSEMILIISTLDEATKDREKQLAAEKAAQNISPLVTKIFPISFAKIEDLSKILNDYLSPDKGKIAVDNRTNYIIVKDTPESIERMQKIVEALDTQTPQILIQSKIVEVSESYSQEIGLQNGLQAGYDPVSDSSATANNGPGFSLNTAPSPESAMVAGVQIAKFSRLLNLNFQLSLMESESKARIVSSPKIITQNKQEATITATDTFNDILTLTDTEGNITQEPKEYSALMSLKVTPQVTNEGSISMEINLVKEHFMGKSAGASGSRDKQSRTISTNVLVDNGSTIVIGGVYNFSNENSQDGVPFLKDLPLLGWLFRSPDVKGHSKSEMVIFLTPRIINQEAAGLIDKS